MLCAGNSELGEVDTKRGIFQEDSLSPLMFDYHGRSVEGVVRCD